MENKIIINAEGAIFGRLCSFAARKALEGNTVIVVNSAKAIITGNRSNVIERYSEIRKKGRSHSLRGPKIPKVPYMIVKRGIRGMLPNYREGIGKKAIERIFCYNTIPEEYKNQKMITLPTQKKLKSLPVEELARHI
jgi:large subunit ribosomal protein L13